MTMPKTMPVQNLLRYISFKTYWKPTGTTSVFIIIQNHSYIPPNLEVHIEQIDCLFLFLLLFSFLINIVLGLLLHL